MAISVVMPALELTQETGKLVSWRKKEGEPSSKGDTLLEVETDKAVVEVEALADGFLAGVKAKEGDVIPVGRTIAWIVEKGETAPLKKRLFSLRVESLRQPPRRRANLRLSRRGNCAFSCESEDFAESAKAGQ